MGVSVSAVTKPRVLGDDGWVLQNRRPCSRQGGAQREKPQRQQHGSDDNFFDTHHRPSSSSATQAHRGRARAASRPPSPRLYYPGPLESESFKERSVPESVRRTYATEQSNERALRRSSKVSTPDTVAVKKTRTTRRTSPSFEENGGYYLPHEDDSLGSRTPELHRSRDAPTSTASAAATVVQEKNPARSLSASPAHVEDLPIVALRAREVHHRKRGFLQGGRRGSRTTSRHSRRSKAHGRDRDRDASEVSREKRKARADPKLLRRRAKSPPPPSEKMSLKGKSTQCGSGVRGEERHISPQRGSFADYDFTNGDSIFPLQGSGPAVVLVSQSDFDIARANMTHPVGTITVPAIAIIPDGHGSFTVNGNDADDDSDSSHNSGYDVEVVEDDDEEDEEEDEEDEEKVSLLMTRLPRKQMLCDDYETRYALPNVSSLLELERNTSGLVKPEYFRRASGRC